MTAPLARNWQTVIAGEGEPPWPRRADLESLFGMHYDRIRGEHAQVRENGVLALALDSATGTFAGARRLKARDRAIDAITIGRHTRCELPLPRDRGVSLRHLLLLSHPTEAGSRLRYRVLDLHTPPAFRDCFGNRLHAVAADGPAVLSLGRYALVLLPTGAGLRLPDSPRAGWDLVGDPLYLEYRTQTTWQTLAPRASSADPSLPPLAQAPSVPRAEPLGDADPYAVRTAFTVLDGPDRPASAHHAAADTLLGTLEVESAGELARLPVGAAAADRGLLIGGYERCDDACLRHLTHAAISRVHVLIIACDGELYAVDTASSNGTFVLTPDGRRVRTRVAKLTPGLQIALADSRAVLRFSPAPDERAPLR